MYSGLSVFDLDHTLLCFNSSYRFGLYLYRQRFLNVRELFCSLFYYARHKWLGLSLNELHQKVFSQLFQGRSVHELEQHVDQFLDQELEGMLYSPAIQRLEQAKQKGQYTMILSSSPDFLVRSIARRLGTHEGKGSQYLANLQGHLCQVHEILEGKDKASYIEYLMNSMPIQPEKITVYSDSYLDLPMLKIAHRAIGVTPDRYLRKVCQSEGWEIL